VLSARQLVERGGPTLVRRLYRCALPDLKVLADAGWHLSRFGSLESFAAKLAAAPAALSSKLGESDMDKIARLRRAGVPALHGNVQQQLMGAAFFTWLPRESSIGDLPGGSSTATDPAFATMFSPEPDLAAREAVALDNFWFPRSHGCAIRHSSISLRADW
jgi:hypothetical protein